MAIAFDAATGLEQTVSGTTLTFAHTCTGSNRLLLVGFLSTINSITSVTYNGASMSQIDGATESPETGSWNYLYYLANPDSGANNVVITIGSTGFIRGGAVSYTGCSQTGIPDSYATETGTGASNTYNTTVVASNCWLVMFARADGGSLAAGSGTTGRMSTNTGSNNIFDSNGTVSTGSQALNTTQANSGYCGIIVSIAPPSTTSVKTYNGLAIASVKTVNGLATGSVKTINGLA